MIAIAVLNRWLTSGPMARANQATARAELTAQQLASEAELVQSLGMRAAAFQRWMGAPRGVAGPVGGPFGPLGAVHGDGREFAAAVPAIGDAGPRGLAGAARRADGGRDDRGVDPAGPRAGPRRDGGRPVADGAGRAPGPGRGRGPAGRGPGGGGAHAAARTPRAAGGGERDGGAAGGRAGLAAGGVLRAAPRSGDGRDRAVGGGPAPRRQGGHRRLAPRRQSAAAGRCDARPIRPGRAGSAHRLSARW